MTRPHVPVLAGELIDALDPQPGEIAVDCTFGAGGHARLVANRIGPTGLLVCIDRDPAAEERFEELAAEVPCQTRFLRMDYADGLPALAAEGIAADMVYLDLGVSSMQIDAWERGFSYSYDAPLDMRMDPEQELDARAVVNGWDERRLASAFQRYGEERFARPIARAIVKRRASAPFETTGELAETIKSAVPAPARFGGGHPAKRVFQAIRIVVNDELGSLDRALPAAWELLRPGGRLAAVSFHSLEDRRVKRFLADRARGCICPPDLPVCACGRTPEAELLTRRAIVPAPPRSPRTRARAPASSARPASSRRVPSGAGRHRSRAAAPRRPRRAPQRPAPRRSPAPRRRPAKRPAARGAEAHQPAGRRAKAAARLAAIPRSPFVDRLLTGRVWIVLLAVLLAGIVSANVALLEMNAGIAQTTEKVTALKRENSRLRLQAARLGSSERIQRAAADLGLVLPAPGEVRYLDARPARTRRLR